MSAILILVVDDDKNLRDDLVELMEISGFAAQAAENALQACDIVKNGTIHLIISDYDMPGMNGLELLDNVRSADVSREIPFILLSGLQDLPVEDKENFWFLRKPVVLDVLLDLINRIAKKIDA